MAFSSQSTVSDGTLVYLALSIDYLNRDDILVLFNGLEDEGAWDWVGETESAITFSPAVAAGVEVKVQRSTKLDNLRHIFTQGAAFNNSTMDENFTQLLFLTQEAVEGSGLTDIFNDVDYHGNLIKNLGVAVDPTDAVSLGQATSATAVYADAAAASAIESASFADLAERWATEVVVPVEDTLFGAKYYAEQAATVLANTVQVNVTNTFTADQIFTGNIGIGTDAPSARLEVARLGGDMAIPGVDANTAILATAGGGSASSGAAITLAGGNTSICGVWFGDTDAGNVGGIIYNHSSNNVTVRVAGVGHVDLNSSGRLHATLGTVPVGSVMDWAGTTAPSGYLLLAGQAISRTTYAELFAVLGTTFGVGNGTTTFNIPDARGRVIAGKDDMGGTSANRLTGLSGGINGDVLGAVGGAEAVTLTAAQIPVLDVRYGTGTGSVTRLQAYNTASGSATLPNVNDPGPATAHNNVQPTLIFNKIIYSGVV